MSAFLLGGIKIKPYILYNNVDGILVGENEASSEEAALTDFKSEYYLLNKYSWEAFEHCSLATSNKSHIIMHKDVFINHLMQKCQKPLFR